MKLLRSGALKHLKTLAFLGILFAFSRPIMQLARNSLSFVVLLFAISMLSACGDERCSPQLPSLENGDPFELGNTAAFSAETCQFLGVEDVEDSQSFNNGGQDGDNDLVCLRPPCDD
jgi:hypothetical protein